MKGFNTGLDAETLAQARQEFPQLKDLDDALEAIARAKVALQDLPAKWALDSTLTEERRWLLAWYLYYGFPVLRVTAVAQAFFHLEAREMSEILREFSLEPCGTCGERTVSRGCSRGESFYNSCEACRERKNEEYRQSREQQWEELYNQTHRLRALPYAAYLQTDHWQDLRWRMLCRAQYRCQLCNAEDHLNVHHRTYGTLGEEQYADLIVLCHECHGTFHAKVPAPPNDGRAFEPASEDLEEDTLP